MIALEINLPSVCAGELYIYIFFFIDGINNQSAIETIFCGLYIGGKFFFFQNFAPAQRHGRRATDP